MDETRLEQGSLVASGGWCAPSETLYDLLETESRDGLYSLPEIAVKRGGINFTKGPTFAELFTDITGFHYTEDQDIAGEYGVDANGMGNDTAGDKPCYKVECPPFEEVRLDTDGLCISAGLLQSRGYPEMISRTIRGALVVRDHRTSGRILAEVAAGSTPVTMTAGQVGATAPLLKSIELQVEHYKYVHRLARNTTLEAVFPFWVKGVIRQDLSQRLGLALFDVTDQQIDAWFRSRGVNPQYVYNWQDITGPAGSFLAWPDNGHLPALLGGHLGQGRGGCHLARHHLRLHAPRTERLHRAVHRGRLVRRQEGPRLSRRDRPAVRRWLHPRGCAHRLQRRRHRHSVSRLGWGLTRPPPPQT